MQYKTSSPETSEISLKLDHYDDIFSDFDMRGYSERALSVDFLEEIRRASRDKASGGVQLALHMPEHLHNESDELVIRDRLKYHFRRHLALLKKDKRRVLGLGIGMVVLGAIFMLTATSILFEDPSESWGLSFLVVFLEPAAWFLLWEGMDQIIFSAREINPELEFYRKMSDERGQIAFRAY